MQPERDPYAEPWDEDPTRCKETNSYRGMQVPLRCLQDIEGHTHHVFRIPSEDIYAD